MVDPPLRRAQGMIVVFLASVLERRDVIEAEEFGSLLDVFAATVSRTDPEEGQILISWAAAVRDLSTAVDLD